MLLRRRRFPVPKPLSVYTEIGGGAITYLKLWVAYHTSVQGLEWTFRETFRRMLVQALLKVKNRP